MYASFPPSALLAAPERKELSDAHLNAAFRHCRRGNHAGRPSSWGAAAQTMLTLPKVNEDRRTDEQKQADAEKKKALDEAYRKAGESIPEPKTKFDPWKNTR